VMKHSAIVNRLGSETVTRIWVLAILLFAAPLIARLYILAISIPLNPDEAQWTVTARRALSDPILWRSIDMQTSGPLNALAISWPILFGRIPTIATSRLTGFVFESLCFLGMASILRREEIFSLGSAAILSAVVSTTFPADPNYMFYSSEIVSLTLIVGASALLAFAPDTFSAGPRLAFCGFLASCLPFAKIQSAPFFVLLHSVCLMRLVLGVRLARVNATDILGYILASVLPALLLVGPLFLVGEQDAFFKGYLGLASGYGGQRSMDLFRPALRFTLVMATLLITISLRYWDREVREHSRPDLLVLSWGLWPAVFLAIWLPGRTFLHYFLFALFCLPLTVLLAQRSMPSLTARASLVRLLTFIAIPLLALTPSNPFREGGMRAAIRAARMDMAFAPGNFELKPRPLLAWTGAVPGRDTMFVWGWEPELTAYALMSSADRAAEAEYLIRPNNERDYFRSRLLKDLARSNPAIVIDAVRPGAFFSNYPELADPSKSALKSFPELDAMVKRDYELVAGDDSRCPAIYLRRDKANALRSVEIPLRSSIPTLVQGPGTEECGDWWAPDSALETAEITVEPPQPIGELWILASRGGAARVTYTIPDRRGSPRLRVTFVALGGARSERVVQLYDYPNWTVVTPPTPGLTSKIEIETLEFVGKGPALAWVKAFKASL
jgi:hypothetical protein